MTSKAKPLKDEVIKHFYKFVEQKGFTKEKSVEPYFTEFRRNHNNEVQVFEIQWDKYWRPYFVINFGKISPDNNSMLIAGSLQRYRGGSQSNCCG